MIQHYHDETKHHFRAFARSLGYLDWATQPNPFRHFTGAEVVPLSPHSESLPYDDLFAAERAPAPLDHARIADLLRHSLGLSARKRSGASVWSLRVNPSSGNLHPTEAYLIAGAVEGLAAGVYHYAPDLHALERRCTFPAVPDRACAGCFVVLASIHWREAWKYGERAFRYCQHDLGHAIAALRLAASLHGWRARLLPRWSRASLAAVSGVDRDEDFVEAEREEPACILAIETRGPLDDESTRLALIQAAAAGQWTGRASQLSEDHVEWSFIDEAVRATAPIAIAPVPAPVPAPQVLTWPARPLDARAVILQRRSAVAFDGISSIDRAAFLRILSRVMPAPGAPWDALWWSPRVHLVLFVHRVNDMEPGLYLLVRDEAAAGRLRDACGRDFLWERDAGPLPLWRLARGNCRALAQRLSCDQAIAADGFFSLGMLADFDASLAQFGEPFYRNLFWESGVVGQVLYLEAEAAGARGTGIGCFYDDGVHDVLGLSGHAFQSLYHFTVGAPVEDRRVSTDAI